MNRQETRAILDRFEIHPSHSLGQNFLVDERIIARICDTAGLTKADLVLEIGPGVGNLTRELARLAGQVIAVEIDRHILPALQHSLADFPNSTVRHADALKVNLAELTAGWPGPVKVVANLPYYITTPLLVKIICELPDCRELVLMIQKEAAGRVMAGPGSKQYGPLAILTACFGAISREIMVPAGAFLPQPAVDSCVIRIIAGRQLQIADWPAFRHFLETCFARRRRTLANNLKTAGLSPLGDEQPLQVLDRLQLAWDVRAEMLEKEQFVVLFNQFHR